MPKLALIALDGPSGVGKSTTARAVAERLGWEYLDTGAMYRSVALALHRAGVALADRPAVEAVLSSLRLEQIQGRCFLNGDDVNGAIRSIEVTRAVSAVSADSRVRAVLLDQQRAVGARGRFVVDGRDIGTVIFPEACCKVFLTATAEARARRRFLELQAKGIQQPLEEILVDQQRRDEADSTRAVAPLRKASDATELDSSELSLEEVVSRIVMMHENHDRT